MNINTSYIRMSSKYKVIIFIHVGDTKCTIPTNILFINQQL